MPDDPVPEFEQHNYQLRFNSALAAGLPIIVMKGADAILEKQIDLFGGGVVIGNMNEIEKINSERGEHAAKLPGLAEYNTIEKWLPTLREFFGKVIRNYAGK